MISLSRGSSAFCVYVLMRHTEGQERAGRDSVRTDVDGALSDHGAVGLVDDVVDQLEVKRVRDDLVVGKKVLLKFAGSELASCFFFSPIAGQSKQIEEGRAKTNLVDKHGCGCESTGLNERRFGIREKKKKQKNRRDGGVVRGRGRGRSSLAIGENQSGHKVAGLVGWPFFFGGEGL